MRLYQLLTSYCLLLVVGGCIIEGQEVSEMKYVVGISEIVLWVGDKAKSVAFYRDLLGLEVISPAHLPNVFLKVGEGHAGIPQMIVLVPKPAEVLARPSGNQLHHL